MFYLNTVKMFYLFLCFPNKDPDLFQLTRD